MLHCVQAALPQPQPHHCASSLRLRSVSPAEAPAVPTVLPIPGLDTAGTAPVCLQSASRPALPRTCPPLFHTPTEVRIPPLRRADKRLHTLSTLYLIACQDVPDLFRAADSVQVSCLFFCRFHKGHHFRCVQGTPNPHVVPRTSQKRSVRTPQRAAHSRPLTQAIASTCTGSWAAQATPPAFGEQSLSGRLGS